MTDWNGVILKSTYINDKLHFYLGLLFEKGENFLIEISSVEEIRETCLWRTSDTRVIEMNVSVLDIDIVNQWKSIELAKGCKPSRAMRQHYVEAVNLKALFLRYTKAT